MRAFEQGKALKTILKMKAGKGMLTVGIHLLSKIK